PHDSRRAGRHAACPYDAGARNSRAPRTMAVDSPAVENAAAGRASAVLAPAFVQRPPPFPMVRRDHGKLKLLFDAIHAVQPHAHAIPDGVLPAASLADN